MINVASLVTNFCMCSPSFIHPAVCGSLSYFKWFATFTSATPMFNPCMSIHHLFVCGSLSYFKWFAMFTCATPMFNPCMCSLSFIHPAVCSSLSYFKWFATFTSATLMFNPCMCSPSFIHPVVCGLLSYLVVCHVHKCDTYVQPLHVQSFIHPSFCMWFAQLL